MSQSSDDEGKLTLYSQREDWKDITPIQQHENITPVAPIFYTDEYREASSYFRAIVQAKEHSQRVLDLTLHIINLNPAHYTVWQYRWATLLALHSEDREALLKEQTLMEDIAVRYLKTYQVWHYRRLLLIKLANPSPELLFISNALQTDAKNYHTWAYRQWIINHFASSSTEGGFGESVWEDELAFAESMVEEDVRNNSAWHHRFFIVFHPTSKPLDIADLLRRELRYVKTKIALAPSNLSAWNYLRGILQKVSVPLYHPTVLSFVQPFTLDGITPGAGRSGGDIDLDNPGPGQGAELPCVYAVEYLADALAAKIRAESDRKGEGEVVALYKRLAGELDPMRKSYWNYRAAQLTQLDQLQAQEAAA